MDSMDDVFVLNNIFTDFWFSKYKELKHYDWVIQLKSSGEVIGRLRGINPNDRICQIEMARAWAELVESRGYDRSRKSCY